MQALNSCGLVDRSQGNGHVHLLLATIDGDLHGVADSMVVHDAAEIARVIHVLAVDGDDQISTEHDGSVAEVCALGAAVESGAVSSAAGKRLHNQDAVVGGKAYLFG